jgi:acid phosphatase type 7
VRIAVVCALFAWLAPAGLLADDSAGWFRKGPYLQHPSSGGVTVVWEGEGIRPGELRILGTERVVSVEPAHRQRVRVEGLEPGTRYTYEVRAGDAAARGELRTAPGPEEAIRFAVFGNTRLDERVQRLLAARVRDADPAFVLGTGNLVSDGLSEHDWQQFFQAARELVASAPLYAAIGRHDLQGSQRGAKAHQEHFGPPDASPGQGRYYAFSHGPARVLILDSNLRDEEFDEQTAWLEAELQATRADGDIRHVFAVTHHAPFSVGLHGGDARIREAWTPLFETHGVDAVFSAHDHVYSRAEHGGVRYFVTGGGGAPLYRQSPAADEASQAALRRFESAHHHLLVDLAAGVVEVSAVRLDGSVIETLAWGERRPMSPELAAEVQAFLAPPEPPPQAAPAAPLTAAGGGPSRTALGYGLGALGLAFALAGGGAILYARRRG